MTVTNGYTTLAEFRQYLKDAKTYTATTISFANATSKIADSALGLKRFQTGDIIEVSGTDSNDGSYTVATGNVAAEIVTSEALTDEAVGDTVIISAKISSDADQYDDNMLERNIEAVSRVIDLITWRRFYAATETRYYTAERSDALVVDDLLSVTTLKTDSDGDRTYEDTWTTSDYDLMPFNATLDGAPYRSLEITPDGDYSFPTIAKGVELKGSFGYSSTTPPPIEAACLLGASRLYQRKSTPLGVSAAANLGQLQVIVTKLKADPDFMGLVGPYTRIF
jgi:hypothetical protein